MTSDQLDLRDPRWNGAQAALRDFQKNVRDSDETLETGCGQAAERAGVAGAETAHSRNDTEDT